MATPKGPMIDTEKVRVFEKTEAQLEGFFDEIGNLAKKKPDDAINKFKLGFINQMLDRANGLLGDEYRPFPDFDKFDIDSMPTCSDVVTMLSQYLRSMDKFRADHIHMIGIRYYWNLPEGVQSVEARRPKKFDQ